MCAHADRRTDFKKKRRHGSIGVPFSVLTDEEVPFRIEVCLVCKTAPHDVVTVVVTGFQPRHAAAVRTVQHLGQGSDARWSYVHL